MKLYLTGEPCSQQRHCYYVEGSSTSFIVDCGFQRCYAGDEYPHLTSEQIRCAQYLFLTHSHENQAGGLEYLYNNGFTGRVVVTAETA
ncbi:MAG: MBL fold metallo-hydrolase, partial [Clostridia bacterium]|nr:MBL fold metallo-hydrolase [Clostridia bacterium]